MGAKQVSAKIDLTGKRFGRLVVIEQDDFVKYDRPRWLCRCDCGNEIVVRGNSLRQGDTVSCGCVKKEHARALAEFHITHGRSKSRIYHIWFSMKSRCHKVKAPDYSRYGGRGIIVCDEWRNSFQAFYDWAIANGYQEDLSIDRINNNGNYCPENCRWVDSNVQNNNTNRNHYVTYNGETLTIAQWSKKCGISKNTLHSRLTRYGWSIERALAK